MKVLVLNLKKEYFQEIKLGIKKEEYRLCTPYWSKRLIGKEFDKIAIKLGYPSKESFDKVIYFDWNGYEVKKLKHKHFGEEEVEVFAIKLIP